MFHPDEIAVAVLDKQVRYRHQAYRRRPMTRPLRRWSEIMRDARQTESTNAGSDPYS